MRTTLAVLCALSVQFFHATVYADSGHLFKLKVSGAPGNASITLCLNGIGQLSCQNYTTSLLDLSITTTIPKHRYDSAGIRINSGGSLEYTDLICKAVVNGFCIFSVSDTTPFNISLKNPDYVIIGAGTSGSVLARKLSDDKKTSVVALHKGANFNKDPLITLSINSIITVFNGLVGAPLYAMGKTTPQLDANNRIFSWIYALPFGGASAVNASFYARGTTQVYSQWELLNGVKWSTTRILNIFKELETYTGLTASPNSRGEHGLLPVWQQPTVAPMTLSAFMPALQVSLPSIPVAVDYNDPSALTCIAPRAQYTQMGARGELRASSAISFLNNTVIDSNGRGVNGRQLRVVFNVTADNIIWQGNTAVGVRYYEQGVLKKIYASKGVIVTAGVKSSAFLMRSGVGPAALLKSLNIPVVYDNPNVGKNLKDQLHLLFIYQTDPAVSPSTPLLSLSSAILTALAQTNVGQQWLFYIGNQVVAQNSPIIQTAWLPVVGGTTERAFRFAVINPVPGYAVVLFDLLRPKSSGSIRINSSNPFAEPTIDLGIFTNNDDYVVYSEAVKVYIKNITQNLSLNPLYKMVYPDSAIFSDDAVLKDFILSNVGSDMYFQGHCKMAPLNQGGVVDSVGHVYGVKHLIVADDSIVPVGVDGGPMASAYMIAYNIANMILGV